MKNSILKSTVIPFLSVCLLAGNIALASGSGRNGPDESGISIPADVDRVLTTNQFYKAVSACQKPALISLFSQVIRQQVTKVEFSKLYPNTINFSVGNQQMYAQMNLPIYEGTELVLRTMSEPFALRLGLYDSDSKYPDYALTPNIAKQVTAAAIDRANFDGGIAVRVEIKKDSGYDDLRNFDSGEMYITKYEVTQSPISRGNGNTNLKLSAEDFKQCLQNQMQ